jgi:hypothetical protein
MKKDDYLCETDEELTFCNFPVEMELVGDEVYVSCKGVTGTLTQAELYLDNEKGKKFYFGESRIRNYPDKMVKIDCLIDTRVKFLQIYKEAKKLKNEHNE